MIGVETRVGGGPPMEPTSCAFPIVPRGKGEEGSEGNQSHVFLSSVFFPYHSVRGRSLCHMGGERERKPINIHYLFSHFFLYM
jgi:hypothetical protein